MKHIGKVSHEVPARADILTTPPGLLRGKDIQDFIVLLAAWAETFLGPLLPSWLRAED